MKFQKHLRIVQYNNKNKLYIRKKVNETMPVEYYGYSGKVRSSVKNQNTEFLLQRMAAEARLEEWSGRTPELTRLEQSEAKEDDRPEKIGTQSPEQSHSLYSGIPYVSADSSPSAEEMRAAYQSLPAMEEAASEVTARRWIDKKI